MHMYAKKIGEVVKEHYDPKEMMCSPTAYEDLKELGKWVDIMKDLASFDKDMRIIEAMDEPGHDENRVMGMDEIITHAKRAYAHADAATKVTMKAEMTKLAQSM